MRAGNYPERSPRTSQARRIRFTRSNSTGNWFSPVQCWIFENITKAEACIVFTFYYKLKKLSENKDLERRKKLKCSQEGPNNVCQLPHGV